VAAEVAWNGVSECPPLETIAAFVDGRLSGVERDRIAAHVASCETCYFVFTESAQTEPFVSRTDTPSAAPGWWQRPVATWSAAAAGLAAAAALAIAVTGTLSREEVPQLTALVAAVGTDRTIEPRLTGGFAHGPLRGTLRSGDPTTSSVSPDVRIAAAGIEKQTASAETPRALQARGIALLVTGNVDDGIRALERASALAPNDARVLSDLSAAYLARSRRDSASASDDASRALAAANRALNADRSLIEPWFNRALALERLGSTMDAQDAWRAYLTIDDRSGWADEARLHLRDPDPSLKP
jgi:tetratricopeptide (TPR) repeat protein